MSLDTTQDIAKKDQLSIIIRHVKVIPKCKVEINERFLGFMEVLHQGAEGITKDVVQFLSEKKIDLSKCNARVRRCRRHERSI